MFTWQAAAIILVVLIVLVLALAIAIYRLALNFALQAIRPKPVRYGAVLSEEVTRNHLDASLMDLKYDKLFLTNRRGQELTARPLPDGQPDRPVHPVCARLQLSLDWRFKISADAAEPGLQRLCARHAGAGGKPGGLHHLRRAGKRRLSGMALPDSEVRPNQRL